MSAQLDKESTVQRISTMNMILFGIENDFSELQDRDKTIEKLRDISVKVLSRYTKVQRERTFLLLEQMLYKSDSTESDVPHYKLFEKQGEFPKYQKTCSIHLNKDGKIYSFTIDSDLNIVEEALEREHPKGNIIRFPALG